jgi:hypothetical protein
VTIAIIIIIIIIITQHIFFGLKLNKLNPRTLIQKMIVYYHQSLKE